MLRDRGCIGSIVRNDTIGLRVDSIVMLEGIRITLDGNLFAVMWELYALVIGRGHSFHGMNLRSTYKDVVG